MLNLSKQLVRNLPSNIYACLLLATILFSCSSHQQESLALKTDPITLDLYHKFEPNQEFKLRGSIQIKPKTEYRVAQASILSQTELSDSDVEALKKSTANGDSYYLKASLRKKKGDKTTSASRSIQTLVKTCSLYNSDLADFITVNLSPLNDFISVNLFTADPECTSEAPQKLSRKFNTTVLVESGALGPIPDTATYIKRLEEERQNKAKEGKEDNRSFFAKYWIYIVPVVIILMVFSGPAEQGR